MIIFPFGFYILDGKTPVYVGNDLDAQNIARAWMDAHPEQIRLGCDEVGPVRILTVFQSSDLGASRGSMDQAPLLFETTVSGGPDELQAHRRYRDYDAAREGHAELVELARRRLQ
jgi:hypothetical protein